MFIELDEKQSLMLWDCVYNRISILRKEIVSEEYWLSKENRKLYSGNYEEIRASKIKILEENKNELKNLEELLIIFK